MPRRSSRPPPRRPVRFLIKVAGLAIVGWLGWSWYTLPDPTALRTRTPESSALMILRTQEASRKQRTYRLHHQFVPLSRIAPVLQRAVVLGEDQNFWRHEGLDWGELRKAVDAAFKQGKLGRGASTITQQTAKNLYLSNERSLWRKGKEVLLARRMEKAVSKQRILELYLNFAEWGDGVFGVEMAARRYFKKSASQLDAAEAAVLTAMLPSPLTRDPRQPNQNLKRRARKIGALLVQVGLASPATMNRRLNELGM